MQNTYAAQGILYSCKYKIKRGSIYYSSFFVSVISMPMSLLMTPPKSIALSPNFSRMLSIVSASYTHLTLPTTDVV